MPFLSQKTMCIFEVLSSPVEGPGEFCKGNLYMELTHIELSSSKFFPEQKTYRHMNTYLQQGKTQKKSDLTLISFEFLWFSTVSKCKKVGSKKYVTTSEFIHLLQVYNDYNFLLICLLELCV